MCDDPDANPMQSEHASFVSQNLFFQVLAIREQGKIIILPETHQKLRVRLGVVTNDGLNPRGSPGLCVHQTPEMSDDVYFKCETS